MNWDRIEGNWQEWKGKVRQVWGKLTNDDIDVSDGTRQELAGLLQKRYGHVRDAAEGEIDRFITNCGNNSTPKED